MRSVVRETRLIFREQLLVAASQACSYDAACSRLRMVSLFINTSTPKGKKQYLILDRLFNGDIRRHGVVEHYECGCCVSRDQCLHLMSTVALKCLYRAHMRILSRSHWTGATEAVGDFLPLLLHGVFAAAYLRALSTEDHVAAAMLFCWRCWF